MGGRQLLEWAAYAEIEPFGEERADLRLAAILRMLFSIHRDTEKSPDVPSVADFYANFLHDLESVTQPKKRGKTPAEIKAILLEHATLAAIEHEKQLRREEAVRKRRAK